MIRVGLTGNIGSGKSTVGRLLQQHGAALLDADLLAREATAQPEILQAIQSVFGSGVVSDGQLDRAALAAIVFNDEAKRLQLNGIVHPWVRAEAARLSEEHRAAGTRVLVQDVPLLYENGLEDGFDVVVVVDAPLELRIRRVMERSGLSEEEVRNRDAAQLPLEQKTARADFVIDNSGNVAELENSVKQLWGELLRQDSPDAQV